MINKVQSRDKLMLMMKALKMLVMIMMMMMMLLMMKLVTLRLQMMASTASAGLSNKQPFQLYSTQTLQCGSKPTNIKFVFSSF